MRLNQQKTTRFSKSFLMISLITVAALIGLEIKEFTNRKTQLETHFSSYCESTSNRLRTILTTPLWNFEMDRLKEVSNVEIQDQSMIHSISIYEKTAVSDQQMLLCITKDTSGQIINCQGNPKGTNIEKTHKLIKNNIHIGTLKICFSQKVIDVQTQNLLQETLIRLFFLIVIVVAGLFMAARSLRR
jgi:uncharacterized membrane protein affecting hemolysin expression